MSPSETVCAAAALCARCSGPPLLLPLHPSASALHDMLCRLQSLGASLTRLHLSEASSLNQLPAQQQLQGLKALELSACTVQLGAAGPHQGILQGRTGLTRLSLHHCHVLDKLDHLSTLVSLESLRVAHAGFPGAVLQHLSCLTELDLQHVHVKGLHASVLQPLANLRALNVVSTQITASATAGNVPPLSSRAALLAVLPAMQHLQDLRLDNLDRDWSWPAVSAAYSALIPSSNLTSITVDNCWLPAAGLQHVFAPGRELPLLRHLDLWEYEDKGHWNHAAVSNIASCCPNLEKLLCSLHRGVSLAPLSRLHPSLTHLNVRSWAGIDGKSCVEAVTALTNLQHLRIAGSSEAGRGLEMQMLAMLTALRQLTHLNWSVICGISLSNKVRVSAQLGCSDTQHRVCWAPWVLLRL